MLSTDSKSVDDQVRAAFTGDFLDATDIPPEGFTIEIAGVVGPGTERDSSNKVIDRTIISLKGAKKRLIANKTNLKIIALKYGKKASDWIGKTITLTVRYVNAFGEKNVPVIRIVPSDEHPMTFGMRKHYGKAKPDAIDAR
jgi:hypothetical protein